MSKKPANGKVVIGGYHPEMADLVETVYDTSDPYLDKRRTTVRSLEKTPESIQHKVSDSRPR